MVLSDNWTLRIGDELVCIRKGPASPKAPVSRRSSTPTTEIRQVITRQTSFPGAKQARHYGCWPMSETSEPPERPIEEVAGESPIDLHGVRTEELRQAERRNRNGIKAQQIVGGVILIAMLAGAGIYYVRYARARPEGR